MSELKKRSNIITYLIMVSIAVVVFFVMGEEVPLIERDTEIYTTITTCDGVMPIYPLYAHACKVLWGNKAFDAMVIIQGVLAALSTIGFTLYIRKVCKLNNIATIIVYCLTLMPFIVYLPKANISQIILTESLAFPLTYVLIYFMLKSFVDGRIRYCGYAIVISVFLYLIRSQLLIAILFALVVFFLQLIRLYRNTLQTVLVKLTISLVLAIMAIFVPYKMFIGYLNYVVPILSDEKTGVGDDAANENNTLVTSSSQFDRLIMNRGIILINDKDCEKYYNGEEAETFTVVINSVRLNDATGLLIDNPIDWTRKWDEQGLLSERNIDYAISGLTEYYGVKYPDKTDVEIWSLVKDSLLKFAKDAIIHHPVLFMDLFLRLFFAGLQASIFIQPPSIFVITEIITGVLIVFTAVLLVVTRKRDNSSVKLLLISVVGIVIYAGIVSVIHQPLQRYLIYFQGVYYIGLFTVVMDILSEKYTWICKIYMDEKSGLNK